MERFVHETVLLHETVQSVQPERGGKFIDCTLGGAGHTRLLLEASKPSGEVLAFDQDKSALAHAKHVLAPYENRIRFAHANFKHLFTEAVAQEFTSVQGIVFDLGVSSVQFDVAERGFSYRLSAPLDMRMNQSDDLTAGDLVRTLSEEELAQIFFKYGEEKFARRIAKSIVTTRATEPLNDTIQFAELVKNAIPAAARRTGGHPAKRVFQALRIAVNDELGALELALKDAFRLLTPGGRIAVISFHSLEDRIVKQAFAAHCQGCVCPPGFPICQCGREPEARLVNRKPIVPSVEECARNPRAKSAKLRVLEKF